ncbi:MAG: ATP-dependent Clp protease proteolytic subunit [Clostridia bacterium]|nr:ATP-dependent Clp protease proteolytic subunit [Clostridia bacterium]
MNGTEKDAPAQAAAETFLSLPALRSDPGALPFVSVPVIGQIEGHLRLDEKEKATRYELLLPLLVSLEEDPAVEGILLLLNTLGGDVEAGLALAELIASLRTPTAALVLGGGHSIGIPLAVCADRSFIVPSATMTIHPVRSTGTVIGVPQSFYYFDRMQERILTFLADHSRAKKDVLRRLMMNTGEMANDVGSIIEGPEAVKIGLIDEVGGLASALAYLGSRRAAPEAEKAKRRRKTPGKAKDDR